MSIVTDRQQDEYITLARGLARQLWDSVQRLKSMQDTWNALDYSNNLDNFSGSNEGLTAANIGSVVFDTTNAIDVLFDAGHATNVCTIL